MSTLSNAHAGVENAWNLVQQQWQTTTALWNDLVRHRFEHDFMQAYEPAVHAAIREIDRLAAVIAQARREVR